MQHQQIHSALTGGLVTRPSGRNSAHPDRLLLSATEAADLLGMSLRKFHLTRPALPAPVVIGPRHVRWRRADLTAWVVGLAAAGDRAEPAQLTAGKLKKRASGGTAGGFAGVQTPTASETQAGRDGQVRAVPSNPKSAIEVTV
ncbi:MAG: hypothetical protein H7337_02070 [Rhizobacter sp.]|nr:hypothetical protein [Rhizobacter sp.]